MNRALDLFGLTKTKIRIAASNAASAERVSIILPVLNEADRIEACLLGLIAQPQEVSEILVVDGGSSDGTRAMVERFRLRDRRVRLVDASPIHERWTGKVWGLQIGLQNSSLQSGWILCVDADVTVAPNLVRSLLAHAQKARITTFSIATSQNLSGKIEALLHPAMLTTLIYRFGSPGKASAKRHRVQANGQCFIARRETLLRWDAFQAAKTSLCEDVTIVRRLADCGERVGFYESDGLIEVRMYKDWREAWNNWPRSLPMRDQYFGWYDVAGLTGTLIFQALPLPAFVIGIILRAPLGFLLMSGLLLSMRIGVLVGMARAYPSKPWSYWLSPLVDLPVVVRILQFAVRKRHVWRGRVYLRRKGGSFEPVAQSH
jgi:dolichol-phosphate mannosyltransferase